MSTVLHQDGARPEPKNPAELLREALKPCAGHPTRVGLDPHTVAFGRTEIWLVDYERTCIHARTGEVQPTRTLVATVQPEWLIFVTKELVTEIKLWREEVYLLRAVCYDCFEMVHPLKAVPQQGHLFHAACAGA